jgi:hypothetical protein
MGSFEQKKIRPAVTRKVCWCCDWCSGGDLDLREGRRKGRWKSYILIAVTSMMSWAGHVARTGDIRKSKF